MADINDLSEFRKKKELAKYKESREHSQTAFQSAVDKVLLEWEDASFKKELDQFISHRLGIKKKDVFNLNALSNVEKALGMEIALFYPRALQHNMNGYIAGFNHKKYALATPEMASEAEARVMNILLFLEIRELEKQGII